VFFEPRLGKTKVALDWTAVLAMKGELRRVLVLAPAIALDVWRSELHKHYPYSYHAETFTHEWGNPSRGGVVSETCFFLGGREETFRATRTNGKLVRPKQVHLERWRPDAIIIDESHEYKRPGGRAAQDCWRFVSRQRRGRSDDRPYVLLLTGTPSAKGWRDLFAQFRIMDPSILGTSSQSFDERYCVYGQGPRKYTVIRYRNLPALTQLIDSHSTSCTAEQAGLAGKISFNILNFDLPPKIRKAYDDFAENFVVDLDGTLVTAANVGVKRLRLLQITSGFLTDGRQLHRGKVERAGAWLQLLSNQGEDVVVYARFTAEVDAAAEAARKSGFEVRVIDGRTRRSSRPEILRWFGVGRKGKPRALVMQYQAGSRAIELASAAEVLFLSLPDGWVEFWQCLNRVRGPNQHRPVRITAICGRNTVDRSVLYALRRKEDIHRMLMKDPGRFLRGQY
jgi:SNF2 family DNA or RNA helicase